MRTPLTMARDPDRDMHHMVLLYGFMLEQAEQMPGPMEDPEMNSRIRKAMSALRTDTEPNRLPKRE